MIRAHEGKLLALCDGCDKTLTIKPEVVLPIVELLKGHWRVNDRTARGWQHFCPSCAVEFRADVPLDHEL